MLFAGLSYTVEVRAADRRAFGRREACQVKPGEVTDLGQMTVQAAGGGGAQPAALPAPGAAGPPPQAPAAQTPVPAVTPGPPELAGQVLRPDGTPAVGVKVFGPEESEVPRSLTPRPTPPPVMVDADGNFKFPPDTRFQPGTGGPASTRVVLAVDPDQGQAAMLVTDNPYRPVSLQLAPGGYLETQVVDQDGHPLADIEVAIYTDAAWLPCAWKSDAQGHLVIGPLPTGVEYTVLLPHRLAVWPLDAGWGIGAQGPHTLTAGEHRQLPPLRLLVGGRVVKGSVSDAQGNPVAGALVVGTTATDEVAVTAADGSFVLKGVIVYDFAKIVALSPTQPPTAAGTEIGPHDGATPHLTLGALGSVSGQILDAAGQPVSDMDVFCNPQYMWGLSPIWNRLEAAGFHQRARSDAEGRWRIDLVVPGLAHRVWGWFDAAQNLPNWEHMVTVEPGQALDLGVIKPLGGIAPAPGAGGPPPPA